MNSSRKKNTKAKISATSSAKVQRVFNEIIEEIERTHKRENLRFPSETIWLIGPPASGKTSIGKFIRNELRYKNDVIEMRKIIKSVLSENSGRLDIDATLKHMIYALFEAGETGSCVVDDFVSVTCSRVMPYLFKYFEFLHSENPKELHYPRFKFIFLKANMTSSLDRQKHRPDADLEKYKESFYRNLYLKFSYRIKQVQELTKMHFDFRVVNANGTLQETCDLALKEIQHEKNGQFRNKVRKERRILPNHIALTRKSSCILPVGSFMARNNKRSRSDTKILANTMTAIQVPPARMLPKVFIGNNVSRHISEINEFIPALELTTSKPDASFLDRVKNLEDSVNIVSSEDKKALEKSVATAFGLEKIQTLPQANSIQVTQGFDNSISKEYSYMQHKIIGERCGAFWDSNGRLYFVDKNMQFLQVASTQYRDKNLDGTFVLGVLCNDLRGDICYICNDISCLHGDEFRTKPVQYRKFLMQNLELQIKDRVEKGPIKFLFNHPQLVGDFDTKSLADIVIIDNNAFSAMGLVLIHSNSEFNFGEEKPGFVFSDPRCALEMENGSLRIRKHEQATSI